MDSDKCRDEVVARTWERFVSGAEADLSCLRQDVAESWRRCQAMGVSPRIERAPDGKARFSPNDEDLTQAAEQTIAALMEWVHGERVLLCVSNHQARMLLVRGGRQALDAAHDVNALPGALWDEGLVGNNVLGTGVRIARPLALKWREHYVAKFQDWACCSAPIFHPINGNLVGSFAIAGFRKVLRPQMLAVAGNGARFVANALCRIQACKQLYLNKAFEEYVKRYPEQAVVALDSYGFIRQASHQARVLVGVEGLLIGRRLDELLPVGTPEMPGAQEMEILIDSCKVGRTAFHPVHCDGGLAGNVVILTPRSGRMAAPRSNGNTAERKDPQWSARHGFDDIVGHSAVLKDTLRLARAAADTNYPVLLMGESGVGKELLAHAIHGASARAANPFVTLNGGAFSEELILSELCGYEAGSFTGADRKARTGFLEAANGGTLFLDELQDFGPKAQSVLLRFLEDGTFVRVGGNRPRKSDVRVIAACNLGRAELEKRVRSDLLYRLDCITLEIPPLRKRPEDIRPIGEKILREDLHFSGRVDERVWSCLRNYTWPGNVRELRNTLLRVVLQCGGDLIRPSDLPLASAPQARCGPPVDCEDAAEMLAILRQANGNVSEVARRLGVHRSTVYRRINRYACLHES